MWIICPSCKEKTKISGIMSFKCTSCGKKFDRPVPFNAKDAGIFIVMGILAIIGGAASFAIEGGILGELSPFILILGAGTFLKGVFQRLFADKSVLVIDEIEKSKVVREYPVLVLELEKIADYSQAQAGDLEKAEAKAYYNLGIAYAKKRRYQKAIEAYQKAIELNPGSPEVHANLGNAYLKMGCRDGALEQYNLLETMDSEWADKLLRLINQFRE